jgi:hypothetical protein
VANINTDGLDVCVLVNIELLYNMGYIGFKLNFIPLVATCFERVRFGQ